MIKILINGINGKMGTEVAKQIKKHPNMYLLGGFDRHIIHNLGFPVYNDFNNTTLYTFDGTTTTLSSPDIVSVNTLILASDYNGLESTHNTYSNICFTYTPCSCNGHICSCDGVDSSCYLRCYPETPGTCDPLDACGDFSYESYTSS